METYTNVTVQMCLQVIDTYRLRYGWELLPRETFGQRVYARVNQQAEVDLRRTTLHVYTEALYQACSGAAGRERQERGYTELYQYLMHCATQRYPDVRFDAAQNAIERVYQTFGACRNPETFLAFALQKLRDAGRSERRQANKIAPSLDAFYEQCQPADSYLIAPDDPLAAAIVSELQQQITVALQGFVHRHPRATQQIMVLWLKYIADLDDETISQRLGKSVASIHVLRSRALAKLRSDAHWRSLASELGFGLP